MTNEGSAAVSRHEAGDSPYVYESAGPLKDALRELRYAAAYRVWRRAIARHLVHDPAAHGPLTLLEVGCGPGNFSVLLERWFGDARITAFDMGWGQIRGATRRTRRVRFMRASSEVLPLRSDRFEVVSALQVIEHFESPERFLREAHRVLRPGGLLLLSTPNTRGIGARWLGDAWQGIRDDHISLRSPDEWRAALADCGFEPVAQGTTLFNGLPVVGRAPLSLPFQLLQAVFGWFPWSLGESYMVVARRSR